MPFVSPHTGFGFLASCVEGRILCMQAAHLAAKISEITTAARLLLDDAFTYEVALVRHRQNVRTANVNRSSVPLGPTF